VGSGAGSGATAGWSNGELHKSIKRGVRCAAEQLIRTKLWETNIQTAINNHVFDLGAGSQSISP